MTRFLSESLGAVEPFFRHGVHKLEQANGHPNADIRLSTEVKRQTDAKMLELGLDPRDTTPHELYQVLKQRLITDDQKLIKKLRTSAATHVSAEAEVVSGMVHELSQVADSRRCYALKGSSFKKLITKQTPRKTMKRLGYRSLPSFLKHESPASIMAAAWLSEDAKWQQRLLEQYQKLSAKDFEDRNLTILQPTSKKWRELAEHTVTSQKHNLLSFKELGALVILPMPANLPPGAVTASLSLALHELNEIRAASSFWKLCQVRKDFGQLVYVVARDEVELNSQVLDRPVPWNLVQRFYSGQLAGSQGDIEPHLQLEDVAWHPIEKTLSTIHPSFSFWHDSAHLGVTHNSKPLSFNIVDVALNACNYRSFEQRLAHYFQKSLWHELLLRYLQPETVHHAISQELQPALATETVEI